MTTNMQLQLWGVRGSIPTPGPNTARYGGNTTCATLQLGNALLVLDAGSGIRLVGPLAYKWPGDIVIALTHLHWDHVQGFPFFAPLFQPGRRIALLTPDKQMKALSKIAGLDGVHFPLKPDRLPCTLAINSRRGETILKANNTILRKIQVNHPGICLGYRVERGGRSVVFIPDNEIEPPYPKSIEFPALVEFCKDADVLIHDSQYLPHEMPMKHGWGHSLVQQTCELARQAQVKRLLLTHHDPIRTDADLDEIQTLARSLLNGTNIVCDAAAEGMTIPLE